MSTKGIYTALSGAMAQNQRLETIANNIANVNTPSFKRDQQVFNEYLTANEKPPTVIQVPKVPASIESFYDMQGGDRSYVDASGSYTDFTQGALKQTGNPLDLGLEGDGLFEVLTPSGVKYTRNGSFRLNSEGEVVTVQGYPLLKQEGNTPEDRVLRVKGNNLTVSFSGNILEDGKVAGRLSIVKPQEIDALKKVGNSLYQFKPNYNTTMTPLKDFKIHQGSLEMSNVNVIREMTDMINTSRSFESAQKAMTAFDQMDDKLVNTVPKL